MTPPRFIRRSGLLTRPSSAFTIIELLVAAAITVVISGLMLSVTTDVLKVWNQSTGRLSSRNQARTVLSYLRRDLQGLVARRDGNVWLAANIVTDANKADNDLSWTDANWTVPTGGTVIKPATDQIPSYKYSDDIDPASSVQIDPTKRIANQRFGQGGVWLRMITNTMGDSLIDDNSSSKMLLQNFSAPTAVGYRIVRLAAQPNSPHATYQLYRTEVMPFHRSTIVSNVAKDNTTATRYSTIGRAISDGSYNLFDDVQYGYNRKEQTADYAGNLCSPTRDQLIANNVIDFGVRFYSITAAGVQMLFPSSSDSRGYVICTDTGKVPPASGPGRIRGNGSLAYDYTTTTFPTHAEVMIRVLTDEGVRLITSFEEGKITRPAGVASDAEYWWQLAEQNSEVFTERIALPIRPI